MATIDITQMAPTFPVRLVAFLDILGFKTLVMQDEQEALRAISAIDSNIAHILDILHDQHGKDFTAKSFSDCISLSCENTPDNVFYMLYELAFIQLYLSFEGIFLRGGFTRGRHFENARMIFSQGVVNAFNLEQMAVYPRILVDKTLLPEILADEETYFGNQADFKKHDFLMKSPDGECFVDYLHFLAEEGIDELDGLCDHKREILKKLQAHMGFPRIVDKYRWLAEYHNAKFSQFFKDDEYDVPYLAQKALINIGSHFPQFSRLGGL